MRIHKRGADLNEQAILDERPFADDAMLRCLQCWHTCSSCRPAIGLGGTGAIPFDAILTWAEFRSLDQEMTELVVTVIERLDHDRAERNASRESLR